MYIFIFLGIVVHGHDGSKFMEELHVGDAIIIIHPVSHVEETKIIRMVLSNVSCGISSPFSTDLISTTSFKFIRAIKDIDPNDPTGEIALKNEKLELKRKADKIEESAFGTYASAGGEKITYRVKHGLSYKIVTEGVSDNKPISREELLNIRSKKKADRHCY